MPRNISPASIIGLPDHKIENVTLENIEIVYPGGGNPLYAYRGTDPKSLDGIPEMANAYPEFSQFKELPAWGLYIRHAKQINLKNVTFRIKGADYRPTIVADDLTGGAWDFKSYLDGDRLKDSFHLYQTKDVKIN